MRARKPNIMRGLDRDVYQLVRRLEESESGKLTVSSVYESIKRSNSSLARQKRRPLEDSIERVLDLRKDEQQADSDSDSDAAIEAAEEQATKAAGIPYERDAFLLNRKLAKSWGFAGKPASEPAAGSSSAKTGAEGAASGSDAAMTGTTTPIPTSTPKASSAAERQANGEPKAKRRKTKEVADRSPPQGIKITDMGGLDDVIAQLLKSVWSPLRVGEAYASLGVRVSTGVLLHGPSGCGKTKLAHALAGTVGVAFVPVAAQALVGGTSGESERNIRDVFEEAARLAPALVFVDEIDAIAGKRESAQKGMEGRMVAEIMDGMDKLRDKAALGRNVVVLAATARPDALDSAIRRRFNVEIEMGMPNEEAREDILRAMTRQLSLAEDVDLEALAKMTPGYVGSDLENVVSAAIGEVVDEYRNSLVAQALARKPSNAVIGDMPPAKRDWFLLEDHRADEPPPQGLSITFEHFSRAVKQVQPASRREGFSTIPDTTWANVGAMADVRRQLETSIIGPIKDPLRYAAVGIKPAAGILLWGPPGCGKTLVAKAVANESKANFISIKGPELLNKYVGESERSVRQLFARAHSSAPCILFFDEMDALAPKREDSLSDASARVVNTLLTELDGVGDRSGIYVVGATNRPDIIDEAIRRPGRLGTSIYVGVPSPDDRVDILKTLYRNAVARNGSKSSGSGRAEPDLAVVARDERCHGFSGADLENLMQAAAHACLERCTVGEPVLEMADWEVALDKVKPSIKDADRYTHLLE